MENQSYLIFRLHELQYGIKAIQVREIFQLPELTLIVEAPGDIIGTLNYRGKVLPVMHLARRLRQPMSTCRLSDSVIVVESQGLEVGVVVNQVYDVQAFGAEAIEPEPAYGRDQHINTAFVTGVAKVEAGMIMLLNLDTLIRQADEVAMMAWEAQLLQDSVSSSIQGVDQETNTASQDPIAVDQAVDSTFPDVVATEKVPTNFYHLYCPEATRLEREIFQQRAKELRQTLETSDISELMPLAVIGLGEEYFGIELGMVREFINIRTVTPIPCCPKHILGDMNLRGEVMTLIDISPALKLSRETDQTVAKAIVIEVDDVMAGITVDQVFDVMYMPPTDITSSPTAVPASLQEYFQGTASYHDRTLSILDLPKLISKGGLMVNQK